MSVEIELDRFSKTYREEETISGKIYVWTSSEFKHNGVNISLTGSVSITEDSGVFPILNISSTVLKPGQAPAKIGSGCGIPFSIKFLSPRNKLYETYHGVKIAIHYFLGVELKKSKVISQSITKSTEIYLHCPHSKAIQSQPFEITPKSLERFSINGLPHKTSEDIPDFIVVGNVENVSTSLDVPLRGFLNVKKCPKEIRSCELRLLRAEYLAEGNDSPSNFTKEVSEIQSLQIIDGDVPRDENIPIYMTFPKHFTCPTLAEDNLPFKIMFELNILIILRDNYVIMERVPLNLWR